MVYWTSTLLFFVKESVSSNIGSFFYGGIFLKIRQVENSLPGIYFTVWIHDFESSFYVDKIASRSLLYGVIIRLYTADGGI